MSETRTQREGYGHARTHIAGPQDVVTLQVRACDLVGRLGLVTLDAHFGDLFES